MSVPDMINALLDDNKIEPKVHLKTQSLRKLEMH